MRFGKLTALTGVLIILLAVLYGCSDDKTTSIPPVTYGSIDDPEFVPVKAQVDTVLSGFVRDVLTGLDNMYVQPGDTISVRTALTPPSVQPDLNAAPDTLLAVYQNGWHFIYATYTGQLYHSRLRDSIQFQVDGLPVQMLDPDVDFVHYIHNWTFTALDPNVTHADYTGRNEFEISDLDQQTAVINGSTANTLELVYIAPDTTMTNTFSFNFTATDVTVPQVAGGWYSGCPRTGTLNMTLSHVFSWTNNVSFGSRANNWTATVTFDDGTATVTATNGEQTWRYECHICTITTN